MLSPVTVAVIFVVVAIGYLLGSIPVADVVARRRAGVDLRAVGDRNPGYWNAKEHLGRRAAVPVFVGDVAKGALAAAVGVVASRWLPSEPTWWLGYVGGGAAMVGHAFPVTARFRGGRSVLTFVGAVVVVAPLAASLAIGILSVTFVVGRRFDVAARVGVAAFPFVQLVVEGPYRTAATGALMTFVGVRFATAAFAARRDDGTPPSLT